ncbi:MAG: DUF308 domain-containing protein [Prochloraceae cyanobacterium]|nr:DUF308 domain-containing protein [Prochloraceae cyanobacterium]
MTIHIELEEKQKLSKKIKGVTALGLLLIVLGIIAIVQGLFALSTTQLLFEEMFLAGGIIRLIYALNTRQSKKFSLKLIVSLIYIVTGLLITIAPDTILLVGFAILASGIVEIILAVQVKQIAFQWGWILLSGIIAIVLGILISSGFNSIQTIGILVGINLLATGVWLTIVSRATYLALTKSISQ